MNRIIEWLKGMDLNRTDDVSTLSRVDRDAYKYQEGNHALIVQVEIQSGKPEVIVYADTITEWLPPHEKERITTEEKERVLTQVCRGLERKKISYRIV
jgi:hypothetical protein